MNQVLKVKLRFAGESNTQRPNGRNLRVHSETSIERINSICDDLNTVLRFYKNSPKFLKKILIDVNYNDIIAKSNRIQALLKPSGKKPNDIVVGARFSEAPEGEENHIITYYVDEETIEKTIENLNVVKRFLEDKLNGKATAKNFNEPKNKLNYEGYNLSKSRIRDIIVDCSVIESLSVPHISGAPDKDSFLVTFYKTELPIAKLFEKLKIDNLKYQYYFYGDDTISVSKGLYDFLESNVPYLISMVSSDFSKITLKDLHQEYGKEDIIIPDPINEPTIGVIDTLFDESVYFEKWVDNTDYLDEIEKLMDQGKERNHGTAISSIIVDGPRLNPWLDDGCGRFKVRHFGVCAEKISTVRLVKKIKEIVENNPDIHVWNLSLGTDDEVSKNFISYDAAVLDELQSQKNIIFVISGTNDNRDIKNGILKVGSPADSLNSIVVNSVRRDGTPASYSRKGNILSFFNKPDVCYYGGDFNERIKVYTSDGEIYEYGTSFAAPWISRKLCYLIDVVGLPREVAKALIIDSAAGWDYKRVTYKKKDLMGYGIVPIDIEKILSSESEEIKFVVYGTSQSYKTTNYAIPVPRDDENKYNDFGVDELVGGYFANMMATIKKGVSFPLFDSISSDVVSAVIDTKILDLSKTDKEIIRHAGVANNILSTLPTLEKASVDEILSFKREMKKPLDNFRIAIYGFSEKISSMPWDDDFKYDCLKLYDTEVVPRVNEINELSSETSVLKNFGKRVLEDEEARKRLGYFGAAGLSTTITTGTNIVSALEILENMIKMGSKIGLAATGITAFLKTADLLNKAHEDVKEKKKEMQKNVMYYYYKASDKIR